MNVLTQERLAAGGDGIGDSQEGKEACQWLAAVTGDSGQWQRDTVEEGLFI